MGPEYSLKVASCVAGQRASAFLQGIYPLANNNNNNNNDDDDDHEVDVAVVVVVCQGAYTLEKGGGSLASDT